MRWTCANRTSPSPTRAFPIVKPWWVPSNPAVGLISTLSGKPNSGLIFLPDAFTTAHSEAIVAAVAQHRLPAIYPLRLFCDAGGLISYGVDLYQLVQQAVSYVSLILRGTNPAELPVQAPTKFQLVINVKAAKAIGVAVPPSLLARADEVIE